MPKTFASMAEQAASLIFLALGCIDCQTTGQTFAPHFQTEFTDKKGHVFTAKPDFYHSESNTFFEFKCYPLGSCQSYSASENKLRTQYRWRLKSSNADTGMKYHEVSAALWHSGFRNDCLESAWNHCLSKHLIIQKALGTENYVVIFGNTLDEDTADKYAKKGLFHRHISQLECLLTPAII